MLNEQQVGRLLAKLVDPVLEVTLKETNGILDIRIKEKATVFLHVALADPEVKTEHFTKNLKELLGQFGFEKIEIELSYLPIEAIERIEKTKGNISPKESRAKCISIASGKGGVGKSTVTANLAIALANQGASVGVIDADIYGFSLPILMGVKTKPQREGDFILPIETNGVKMMSMDFFVENGEPVIWRGPMLGKMVKMFLEEVKWGSLDYLLIDLPPGTGDVALDIHALLPAMHELIVTTPHHAAATVATRAGYMAQKNNHTVLGVVENMSFLKIAGKNHEVFGKGGGLQVAKHLNVELMAQLPIAQPLQNKTKYHSDIFSSEEELGEIYHKLAKKVVQQLDGQLG